MINFVLSVQRIFLVQNVPLMVQDLLKNTVKSLISIRKFKVMSGLRMWFVPTVIKKLLQDGNKLGTLVVDVETNYVARTRNTS